jgi:hypothetical protein
MQLQVPVKRFKLLAVIESPVAAHIMYELMLGG